MSKRWLTAISGIAALAFALIMVYLIIQIDQTRRQLQLDGVLEFNFVQQVDHNYDSLAQSIVDYLMVEDPEARGELRKAYITRYDVLYSSIRNIGNRWLGHLDKLDSTQSLLVDSNEFLDKYEPLMAADMEADTADLISMNKEALALSNRVYDIGLHMFQHKSTVRANISQRMDDLYEAFWIFALFFVVASLLTIAFLFTLSRRAEHLTADARQTKFELTSALDELTTGDIERRAQNRFMAAASHDLRQPLHALGLYLSALKNHVTTPQGQSILANMHKSTEALNQLLHSMLDLSKLDAGVVDVNEEPLNLDDLFDHLHQMFQPEADQRDLILDVRRSSIHVYSDRVLLERILNNLVSNALNYTNQGSVTVSAQVSDASAIICVSDTGPGIPLHEQEAVFNEYYQLQNPERDRSKGLGIGLSIVKRLSRLLNINLSIKSGTDEGTTFQLQLQLSEVVDDANKTSGNTNEAVSLASECPVVLSGLSILVIDDEHDVRDGTAMLLKQQNSDVVTADSPQQACEYIANHEWVPDLIIADYRLRDDTTGDMAIERVRDEVNMDVPAIIITGDTSPERLREATASGFPLLHKPVIGDELISTITGMMTAQV